MRVELKRVKLTDRFVKSATSGNRKSPIFMDDEVIGFGIQVRGTGRKSFTLDYTFEGRRRRFYIGDFPDWSTTAARDQAKQIKREVDQGLDPLAVRDERRRAPTVKYLIERYLTEHVSRLAPDSAADHRPSAKLRKSVGKSSGKARASHKCKIVIALGMARRVIPRDWSFRSTANCHSRTLRNVGPGASCGSEAETKGTTRTDGKSLALSGAPVTDAKTPSPFTLASRRSDVFPRTVLATTSTGGRAFRTSSHPLHPRRLGTRCRATIRVRSERQSG
jgi:Arm DNA-binding domain